MAVFWGKTHRSENEQNKICERETLIKGLPKPSSITKKVKQILNNDIVSSDSIFETPFEIIEGSRILSLERLPYTIKISGTSYYFQLAIANPVLILKIFLGGKIMGIRLFDKKFFLRKFHL